MRSQFRLRMKVGDVMSRPPITVTERTPYKKLIRLFRENRIGAVPVTDDSGRLVGMVSETDLLHKQAHTEEGLSPLHASADQRLQLIRFHAEDASGLMTREAITVNAITPLSRAAGMMQRHGVSHLPVIDRGRRVIGVLSRGDLLRPFLRSDRDIRRDVENVLTDALGLDPARIGVTVRDGVVILEGTVGSAEDIGVIQRLSRAVEGVVRVEEWLGLEAAPEGPADSPAERRRQVRHAGEAAVP